MSEKEIKNEIKSDIQKQILERNKNRDEVPRHGQLQNNKEFEGNDKEDRIFFNFVNSGPKLEIHGKANKNYDVTFLNSKTNEVLKEFKDVKSGEWCQADQEYNIPWLISVKDTETGDTKNYSTDLKDKLVFIAYESSALGDTLAWMPVVDKFREVYGCRVICSSFHNDLFKDVYPEITFVERGVPIQGMQMAFRLGWFGSGHASNRNPNDCHTTNLQELAMDILGLDYDEIGEIRPRLKGSSKPRMVKHKKYVVITTCSTAQFKYWNRANGWQEVVNYLNSKGYKVINVGKQPNNLRDVIDFTGQRDFDDLMNVMQYANFFIGLPSGLAWLSWALGRKSIMITGISENYCEFQEDMYRVENLKVCHGCFNNPDFIFDKGDWLYCPLHKNTSKHFECTREITPQMVKKKIALVEKHLKANIIPILDEDGNMISKTTGAIIAKYGE
jgi:autotransporter strand-loop-strand O-heptosyltransferase